MKLANSCRRAPHKAALMAQTAACIELLLMTAMRRSNLAGLRLGRHVLFGNDPKLPTARIIIDEAETKNGQPLEFELPEASARLLHTYVHRHLPALAAPGQDHLFPGKDGRAKRPDNLAQQVSKAIREHVGCEVNIHLFRALTGRAFLRRNPGLYEVLRRVLGHQSSDTTITYYTGLETEAAARQFDASILELRQQARLSACHGAAGEPPMRTAADDPRRSQPIAEWPEADRDLPGGDAADRPARGAWSAGAPGAADPRPLRLGLGALPTFLVLHESIAAG